MDPRAAMMGGLGGGLSGGGGSPPFPAGPGGLPMGGSLPDPNDPDADAGADSPLVQHLMMLLGGGLPGQGPGEGQDGIEQLLTLLSLGEAGVGGGGGGAPPSGLTPQYGSSGLGY